MLARDEEPSVGQVPAEVTRPLRRRLLRPNNTLDDLRAADGDNPAAGYYAAIGPDARVLAVASARPEAPTWPHNAAHPWRVRGVVTADNYRGRGLGTAVMHAVLNHIRSNGGDLVWLNGRTPARSFYKHLGFEQIGDDWDDPESGPHMTMAMTLGR